MGRLTVVIATYGRHQEVATLLEAMDGQTRPPDEVLVVDDTPGPAVKEVARRRWRVPVAYVRNDGRPSLARARNAALARIQGGLVTFLDSDILPALDYLERIEAAMEADPALSGCMGFVADFPTGGAVKDWLSVPLWVPRATRHRCHRKYPLRVLYPRRPRAQEVNWLYGCNMTYRRDAIAGHRFEAGMERYSYAEDIEFSTRLRRDTGARFRLVPDAVVRHAMSGDGRMLPRDLFRMRMVNRHLFAHRFYTVGFWRGVGLWWQQAGALVFYSYLFPAQARHNVADFRLVARALRERKDAVRAADFSAFNDLYSFWRQPGP